MFKADSIVRVCGDNPLIDPEEIDRLVEFLKKFYKQETVVSTAYMLLILHRKWGMDIRTVLEQKYCQESF